ATMLGGVLVAGISITLAGSLAQLVGLESRQSYLGRVLPNFAAVHYLNERQGEVRRVLVVGDAPMFYLKPATLADQGLEVFGALATAEEPLAASAVLRRLGISHVLVSPGQMSWLSRFDPEQRLLRWWDRFEQSRLSYLIADYRSQ